MNKIHEEMDLACDTVILNTAQSIFENIAKYNQSFVTFSKRLPKTNTTTNQFYALTIGNGIIHHTIKFQNGKLEFYSDDNLFLSVTSNFAVKLNVPEAGFSEYQLHIKEREKPLTVLAIWKDEYLTDECLTGQA